MGSPRVVVIVNPRSQGGALGRRWSELADTIRRALPFEVARTEGPGDATRLAARALRAGAEVVVAVGGDGTINEVANGFFADGQPVAPGAALAILPFGTGGDFVRTARIPKDWAAAVEVLARGARRTIDVGRLDHATRDGGPGVRMFVNIASFGLSGVTDRFVNQGQKRLGGKLSFFAATTRALLAYDNQRVHLVFDEQPADAVDMTINTVAVANGRAARPACPRGRSTPPPGPGGAACVPAPGGPAPPASAPRGRRAGWSSPPPGPRARAAAARRCASGCRRS